MIFMVTLLVLITLLKNSMGVKDRSISAAVQTVLKMCTDQLFVLGLFLLLFGQKSSSQTCPRFGTDGQGLRGSEDRFRDDRRLFLNFESPAQCNGTVTSWQYCYYYDDDDDDIEDHSNSQQYGAKFLVYRRSDSSDTYQPVANSTKLVSVTKRNLNFNSVTCLTVTLASNEQFQIQTNDIIAACVIDDNPYRELRIIRRDSDQDSYQYNRGSYQDCTTQQLQTVDTQHQDFRVRRGYGLLLYVNINSLSTQCSAGSNPPPFSPSTTSGTYLNTAEPVQCTDTITVWHYCYYPSSASDTQTTYTAVIGVWRMNTQYELVTGSNYTLRLRPESTQLAKVVCKSVRLQEGEYVRVNQNDVIGITIPTLNPIPLIASGASGYSLQSSTHSSQPTTLATSQLTGMSNMALHLYPDIEFVPTTPPPTTTEATTTAATTAQSTTTEATTSSQTTQATTPPPTTTEATTTAATTAQSTTTEATTSSQTTQATTPPPTTTEATTTAATTAQSTTTEATTSSQTTQATTPPVTTQRPTTMATSTPPTTLDLSTTSESTTPPPNIAQTTTVESSTGSSVQPGGQETTVASSNNPRQDSRLSIGTLVGVICGTIITALVIVFVSVLIVYKWQLCRCAQDKRTKKKAIHTGIQNVMYDAVDEKVTLDGVQQSYMTLGTIYEEIEPYDVPQKPSPTNFEREKQITIFTQSGDGYYAAVGPGVVSYSLLEQDLVKDVKVQNENRYYSPASEETALYEQIRTQGINLINKEDIEVIGELGAGQFGKVEKGIMKPANVEVAIKSLKSNASTLDRVKFLQEAAIMAQFKHHNVVTLHGVVRDRDTVLIVLDLLSKGDLVHHLSTLKPDPGQLVPTFMPNTLLSFSQQVALGMVYLAGKGFVHRDLAARNILVSEQNICKIADFGMSRDLAQSDYYVSQGGKVPIKWTAPEAIYFKKYSTASDVWSYGCLLYEIWSFGHKPFKGLKNIESMRLVDSGRRLPPPPGCPRVIYEIMIQCWNPEASNRPGFRDVLLALLENEDMVLDIPVEDCSTHAQASVLGAPVEAGLYMYRDIQSIYIVEVTAM